MGSGVTMGSGVLQRGQLITRSGGLQWGQGVYNGARHIEESNSRRMETRIHSE